jgi:hypothetical protein
MKEIYKDKNTNDTVQINEENTVMVMGNGITWQNTVYEGVRFNLVDKEFVEIIILYEGVDQTVGIYPIEILKNFLTIEELN